MTIEELSKLSDEELRVKCAELCGWTSKPDLYRMWWAHKDTNSLKQELPNYPADLNAMHEAEKALRKEYGQWVEYAKHLGMKDAFPDWSCLHATARQRCIAFIATKQST